VLSEDRLVLSFRAGGRHCTLPAADIVETMRPLPVTPVAGGPASVRGVAVIRGDPVPVVSVARLLGAEHPRPTRFVTVRTGRGPVALEVDEILGLVTLPEPSGRDLPPLLSGAGAGVVSALDAGLVVVLDGARLLPDPATGTGPGTASP
jgi:purine-binding chemotaxis protein CheW